MPIYLNDELVKPKQSIKSKLADLFALIAFGVLIALAILLNNGDISWR